MARTTTQGEIAQLLARHGQRTGQVLIAAAGTALGIIAIAAALMTTAL